MSHAEQPRRLAIGVACGAGAALCWAIGFVAARHGIAIGLLPSDIALHRYIWAGLACLPLLGRTGIGGIGWARGFALTLFGGPPQGLLSYAGFLLVPLGHGGVIQPSCAALGGLLLSVVVLKERLPLQRALGALVIVCGLMVIGAEAVTTIGTHGLLGDAAFAAAGLSFATFGMLLRLCAIAPTRAVAVVSVISLGYLPIHWLLYGFENLAAAGLRENAVQAVVQGVFTGPLATYLFAHSVMLLGAGRAAVFASLVPGFTLVAGFLVLGEAPTLYQLAGFVIVLLGFRLTQR
ncbi:MAG: DMT family transporter [Xanthobacteraceae bacterium]